jgi:ribosome assembly protein YihI (activator of Der GTPase)
VTTVITNLLARKEKLLDQLGATEDANQRSDIQRKLEQVDTALEFLGAPERTSE